jgi:hypothetical protein
MAANRGETYLFSNQCQRPRKDNRHQALVVQNQERGLKPSLIRIHYSAGRVAARVSMRSKTQLSSEDKTSPRVLTMLPERSPVTSVRSPVLSHAEMAKR